jgi:hypothetical protein
VHSGRKYLVTALTGNLKCWYGHMSGNATYQELRPVSDLDNLQYVL